MVVDNRTPGRNRPLPNSANKLKDDVERLIDQAMGDDADITNILLVLGQKAAVVHGHVIADVTGLVDALAGKIAVGYHDAFADLSDVDVDGAANGQVIIRQAGTWIPVSLQVGNITNLETLLNAKATPADITAAINGLVNGAGAAYDTLKELGDLIAADQTGLAALTTVVGNKLNTADFSTKLGTDIHAAPAKASLLPADEFAVWNSATATFQKLPASVLGRVSVIKRQTFTASGTYTPDAKMLYCIIEMVGAGAGGGGAVPSPAGAANGAGGGGSGEFSQLVASRATIGASQAVTIGAAGAASANSSTPGGNGGTTSVGTLCTAVGGSGGTASPSSGQGDGGAAGSGGTGSISVGKPGLSGAYSASSPVSAAFYGGKGADSMWGTGGPGRLGSAGVDGTGFGSGGSGASSSNASGGFVGGAGRPGKVIITEFCSE